MFTGLDITAKNKFEILRLLKPRINKFILVYIEN